MAEFEVLTEELWRKQKDNIYRYYITQDLTLKSTMDTMRATHRFHASKTQYTTKLKAWGFTKYNSSRLYPGIKGSLKRKAIDLDKVESVTVSTDLGQRTLSSKQLKKAFGRSARSDEQTEVLDASSPPGLQVRYQEQPRSFLFEVPNYPFNASISELFNVLRLQRTCSNPALATLEARLNRSPGLYLGNSGTHITSNDSSNVSNQLPSSVLGACKALHISQSKDLQAVFLAMFLISNRQLTLSQTESFGEWLVFNVNAATLCGLQSWTAKTVLTHLLHVAVMVDGIGFLRQALLNGASPETPFSDGFGVEQTLLHRAFSSGSVQCAKYLITAGADVSVRIKIQNTGSHPKERLSRGDAPLELASQWDRLVDLIPALLARGASPKGMSLIRSCVSCNASCETIKSLIDAGMNPDEPGALVTAIERNRLDTMELLISSGACVDGGKHPNPRSHPFDLDKYIQSPAIIAAQYRSTEAVELLLRSGVDLNASLLDRFNDYDRETVRSWLEDDDPHFGIFHPIQAAIEAGDCGFVEYLLGKGVSLTPRHGDPLLVLAAQAAETDMVAFLLAHGVNVNSVAEQGPAASALEAAAALGRVEIMHLLIDAGAHIDFCHSRAGSCTPLQRAAAAENLEAVEMLLNRGANICAPHCPIDGVPILQSFIKCGHMNWIVRALDGGASINACPGCAGSPLLAAIIARNTDVVRLLLRMGADVSEPGLAGPPFYEYFETTLLPLQGAAGYGYLDICKILVEARADVDGVAADGLGRDAWGLDECGPYHTPLTHACYSGQEAVAEYLISKGACLFGNTGEYTEAPYYRAICRRRINIVRLLLQRGLDSNDFCGGCDGFEWQSTKKDRTTPLIKACSGRSYCSGDKGEILECELAELLIKHGANVNYRPSLSYNTPLQAACLRERWKLAKFLLMNGADINAPCSIRVDRKSLVDADFGPRTGYTALQAVVLADNMNMVDFLLSKGADVHAPAGSTGRTTALQAAVHVGNVVMAEKLLKRGAQVDEAPAKPDGRTSIQSAAELGRLQMLCLLLHNYHGTRTIPEICDDAIKFADRENHNYVVGYLREYKEQHLQSSGAAAKDPREQDEWINWDFDC